MTSVVVQGGSPAPGGPERRCQFRILGPLEVSENGRPLTVAGGKPRAVLAILLLNANRMVSHDRLIDFVWGEEPPETARSVLQTYVSQLRQLLEPARSAGTPARVLVSQPSGYLLRVERGQLDLVRFEALVEEARRDQGEGRAEGAALKLHEALGLWRGPALGEFDSSPAERERARLEEMRLRALEGRIDAELELGHHADLVGELRELVSEHQLREHLRWQLMLALHRSGRSGEAATVYQEARDVLREELGMEPSPVLQKLLRDILNQDPGLDLVPGPARAARPARAEGTRAEDRSEPGGQLTPPADPGGAAAAAPGPDWRQGRAATSSPADGDPEHRNWVLVLVSLGLGYDVLWCLFWLLVSVQAALRNGPASWAVTIALDTPALLGGGALAAALLHGRRGAYSRPPVIVGASCTALTLIGLPLALSLLWALRNDAIDRGSRLAHRDRGRRWAERWLPALAIISTFVLVLGATSWIVRQARVQPSGPQASADPCAFLQPGQPIQPGAGGTDCGVRLGQPVADLDCGPIGSIPPAFEALSPDHGTKGWRGNGAISLSHGSCDLVTTSTAGAMLRTAAPAPNNAIVVADFTPRQNSVVDVCLGCTMQGSSYLVWAGPKVVGHREEFNSGKVQPGWGVMAGQGVPRAGQASRLVIAKQGTTLDVWLNGRIQVANWTTSGSPNGFSAVTANGATVQLHRFAVYYPA